MFHNTQDFSLSKHIASQMERSKKNGVTHRTHFLHMSAKMELCENYISVILSPERFVEEGGVSYLDHFFCKERNPMLFTRFLVYGSRKKRDFLFCENC